jgi:dihydrofolate reductase
MSRNPHLFVPNATIANSMPHALSILEDRLQEDIFIVGGADIYRLFLSYCNIAYITKIDASVTADVYISNLDEMPDWEIIKKSGVKSSGNIQFHYVTYKRVLPCKHLSHM